MKQESKKNNRLNSIRGTQRFTKPSQTIECAKVIINNEIAIPKLKELSKLYVGITNPHGF